MRLTLVLTPAAAGADRLQAALADRREALERQGVRYAAAPGKKNHTRLFLATSDPGHVDPLRAARGYAGAEQQALLAALVRQEIGAEVARAKPDHYVLAASQLFTSFASPTEITRLRDLLAPLSDDIRLVVHVDEQARMLARFHAEQVFGGRSAGLEKELTLAAAPDWDAAARADWTVPDPALNAFPEVQAPPFWLDLAAARTRWDAVFGAGSLRVRPYRPEVFHGPGMEGEIAATLGLSEAPSGPKAPAPAAAPSEAWLERARQMNARLAGLLAEGRTIPRLLWRRLLAELAVAGAPVLPGSLAPVSRAFAEQNARLVREFPDLLDVLTPEAPLPDWTPPDPGRRFRPDQTLAGFLPRIDKAAAEARRDEGARAAAEAEKPVVSPEAARIMPPLALATFANLAGGRLAPHNRLGTVNEAEEGPPYPEMPPRALPTGSTGTVIVGCMKNEGPYIVEWVAYHRAIGVDNFIIYTNGCEDGTDEILGRLQEMGVLQHRLNDDWKGKSPQQHALNRSLKEPVVRKADWLIHIDVDEFMNIRTGNGTIADLLAAAPDATNIAMTWRLFGYGGVEGFEDRPVIEQFTRCAPAYCPKPHTVWGFKTMFRNIGAYAKMSCHRPNQLADDKRGQVKWVNGSGQPMADSLKDKGWRSGIQDIGYDLVQLNHYALRSAESFLVKRQRGRALHVDRSIGLNYWIRMDWSDHTDLTIRRNLPRLQAEMARLLADPELKRHHERAVDWHRAKAAELRGNPEFRDLYDQALATRLSGMERVAYALALDLDS